MDQNTQNATEAANLGFDNREEESDFLESESENPSEHDNVEEEESEDDLNNDGDDDDNDHESNNENEENGDEDGEEYEKFIKSVFCDDQENRSGTDGDDEDGEDYVDVSASSSEDDDMDIDDFFHVTRREVHDLVDASWHTITKIPDEPTKKLKSTSSDVDGNDFEKRNRMISALVDKIFAGENVDGIIVDDMPISNVRVLVARQMSMAIQLIIEMFLLSDVESECSKKCHLYLTELCNTRESALRKAALISMHMKSMKEYNSVSSNKVNTQNCLDAETSSILNASTANTIETTAVERHTSQRLTRGRIRKKKVNKSKSYSVYDIRMLSQINIVLQYIDKAKRCKEGVLPPLSDSSVMTAKKPNTSSTEENFSNQESLYYENSSVVSQSAIFSNGNDTILATNSGLSGPRRSKGAEKEAVLPQSSDSVLENVENWTKFDKLRHNINQILHKFESRCWNCLIASESYPQSNVFMSSVDPKSLYGTSVFTSSEDDLLLRGILQFGLQDWSSIRDKYLPSKAAQSLQLRYSQMTSSALDNTEDNKFRKLKKLNPKKLRKSTWEPAEDIELFKGYQVFGSKWHMIKLYYLPNVSRPDIKNRWIKLQKDWEKVVASKAVSKVNKQISVAERADGTLSKHIKKFLVSLSEPARYNPQLTVTNAMAMIVNATSSSFPVLPGNGQMQHFAGVPNQGMAGVGMSVHPPSISSYQYHHHHQQQQAQPPNINMDHRYASTDQMENLMQSGSLRQEMEEEEDAVLSDSSNENNDLQQVDDRGCITKVTEDASANKSRKRGAVEADIIHRNIGDDNQRAVRSLSSSYVQNVLMSLADNNNPNANNMSIDMTSITGVSALATVQPNNPNFNVSQAQQTPVVSSTVIPPRNSHEEHAMEREDHKSKKARVLPPRGGEMGTAVVIPKPTSTSSLSGGGLFATVMQNSGGISGKYNK